MSMDRWIEEYDRIHNQESVDPIDSGKPESQDLSLNFREIIRIVKAIREVKVYWLEGSVYHYIQEEQSCETPGGSDALRFIAFCGDERVTYSIGAPPRLHWENLLDAIGHERPCEVCFKNFNIAIPKNF